MPTVPLTIVRQYHPDFCDWESRVRLAGGSVPTCRAISANSMIWRAYNNGLRYKIKYLIGLHLTQSFTGCNVPIWTPSGVGNSTIFNFVSGDWSSTLGLTGDGSTKYLNSKVNQLTHLKDLDLHLACFVTSSNVGSLGTEMGIRDSTSATRLYSRYTDNTCYLQAQNSPGTSTTGSTMSVTRSNIFSRGSTTSFYNQGNPVSLSVQAETLSRINGEIYLFKSNRIGLSDAEVSDRSMSMFTIGDSLSATEASQLNQLMEMLT